MPTVEILGDEVIVTDPTSLPSRRVLTLAEAFAGSGRMLFVRDPDQLVGVLRELAARLGDLVDPRDRARQRFWRAWTPVPARTFTWTWDRGGGREPLACVLEVEGAIARRPQRYYDDLTWQTLDDLFVHGPIQPGIPVDVRAALIEHLGHDPFDAFPRVDRAAIAPRSWSWNQQDDGEEGASIGGATVVIGYQFGHDMGWSEHPVERVISGAADIYFSAPAAIRDELLALLAARVAT